MDGRIEVEFSLFVTQTCKSDEKNEIVGESRQW